MPGEDELPVPRRRTTWRDRRYAGAPRLWLLLGFLALAAGSASLAGATAGKLDPTFGTGGKVITDFGRSERASAVLVARDGKAIVVGTADDGDGNQERLVLARYDTKGRLDPSFGEGGKSVVDLGAFVQEAYDAALQADGKILVAGAVWNPGARADFLLARLNADGALDRSFGTGGIATVDFGSTLDYAYAILLQPDGKVVLVGWRWQPRDADRRFALARFNGDGSLDTAFGSGGRVVTQFGAPIQEAYGAALQADGKIVVVGSRYSASDAVRGVVARYTATGALDASFDGDGWAAITDGGAEDVAVGRDGAILVSGYSGPDPAVYRYKTRGRLDTHFGLADDGIARVTVGQEGVVGTALAVQPDGEIVVVGGTSASLGDVFVFRFNPDGMPDDLFGRIGVARIDLGLHSTDLGDDIAVQKNGKILVAGFTTPSPLSQTPYRFDFALARFQGAVCLVPTLKGKTLRAARQALARGHCRLGKAQVARSKVVRKGRIISQRPGPGARRVEGTQVRVVVSRG